MHCHVLLNQSGIGGVHADRFLSGVKDYGSALDPLNGTNYATLGANLARPGGAGHTRKLTLELASLTSETLEELSRVLKYPVFSHLCPGVEGAATYGGQNYYRNQTDYNSLHNAIPS
jgi:hypothetical protein